MVRDNDTFANCLILPHPSLGPKLCLASPKVLSWTIGYTVRPRDTLPKSCTDLDNEHFWIGSQKIWDARIYIVKTLSCTFVDDLACRPIHLYLIFEKSSLKNQVWWNGFLAYFELDFYCLCSLQKSISKLIFAG